MFSTILAYGTFTVTTLLFLALIIDTVIPKTDTQQALDWRKVFVLFALWVASGIYIWG